MAVDGGGKMNDAAVVALSPETVLGEMKKNGVTHVVWLPDSETNWLYLLMKAEPALRLVGVSREGHACSIAAGSSAGGAKPLILIQNTGMMESGDSLRGWLLGLNVPVVLMVGYRGWARRASRLPSKRRSEPGDPLSSSSATNIAASTARGRTATHDAHRRYVEGYCALSRGRDRRFPAGAVVIGST